MKTAFSRQFGLTAGMVLLSFILLGFSFTTVMYTRFVREEREDLSTSAEAVVDYLGSQGLDTAMEDWDIRLSISYGARVSGSDVLVVDTDGGIQLCSCDQLYCDHLAAKVPQNVLNKIRTGGSMYASGMLENVYDEERYLYGLPVLAQEGGEPLGYVIVSSAIESMSELMETMVYMFLMTAIVVLMVTTVATVIISQRQTRIIRDLARASRQFAHGDFSARVRYDGEDEDIADLTVAFNNMATSLQKAEDQRQEFISNVSHELKTPMTSIAGFMDGMLDGTIPRERHTYYMQTISNEVKRLSRMVRSMLEISRLSSTGQEITKERFDVTEALGMTLLSFEQKIDGKQLDVQVSMPDKSVYVMANRDSITQVIYNLIDNGVKFAEPETPFCLKVTVSGNKAMVSVSNTGTSTIPPDELPLLFERFHKSDKSRSEDTSGVGLGLYIVKTILGSHGEDITVTSRDNVTTFTFSLTLSK